MINCERINNIERLIGTFKNSNYDYCDCPFVIFRDCYKEIYMKMKRIIIPNNKTIENLKQQKCFLVYGNSGIGKSSFCRFLSYCFNNDKDFAAYDIIVYLNQCCMLWS